MCVLTAVMSPSVLDEWVTWREALVPSPPGGRDRGGRDRRQRPLRVGPESAETLLLLLVAGGRGGAAGGGADHGAAVGVRSERDGADDGLALEGEQSWKLLE